jgi:hypothetical protein
MNGARCRVLTLTRHEFWRRAPGIEPRSGNLDPRGTDTWDTVTVDEYVALSPFL